MLNEELVRPRSRGHTAPGGWISQYQIPWPLAAQADTEVCERTAKVRKRLEVTELTHPRQAQLVSQVVV